MRSLPQWDSLGHLNILVALDKRFSGQVAKIPEFAKATSVRKLVSLLEEQPWVCESLAKRGASA